MIPSLQARTDILSQNLTESVVDGLVDVVEQSWRTLSKEISPEDCFVFCRSGLSVLS